MDETLADLTERDAHIATQFLRVVGIMRQLRSEDGCPWDKEQDHASLKKHLVEEAYEVVQVKRTL